MTPGAITSWQIDGDPGILGDEFNVNSVLIISSYKLKYEFS